MWNLKRWPLTLTFLAAFQVCAEDGRALYNQHCAVCHQNSGGGSIGRVPPLIGPHWSKLAADPSYPVSVVLNGLQGEIRVGTRRFDSAMPSFAKQLTDAQVAEVANYLAVLRNDENPLQVTPDQVASERRNPRTSMQQSDRRRSLLGD